MSGGFLITGFPLKRCIFQAPLFRTRGKLGNTAYIFLLTSWPTPRLIQIHSGALLVTLSLERFCKALTNDLSYLKIKLSIKTNFGLKGYASFLHLNNVNLRWKAHKVDYSLEILLAFLNFVPSRGICFLASLTILPNHFQCSVRHCFVWETLTNPHTQFNTPLLESFEVKAARSSVNSIATYQTTRCHKPNYTDADKSLARPGRKQTTATEDFEFRLSHS